MRDYSLRPDAAIEESLREPVFVPDTVPLLQVLRQLQQQRQELAVVVDEYGGTEGIVTIEDILEEIFGEIHDEYDPSELTVRRVESDRYRVNARLHLDDLEACIGIRLEEAGIDSVGGFVATRLGRVPAPGDEVVAGPARLRVRRVRRNRVIDLDLEIVRTSGDGGNGGGGGGGDGGGGHRGAGR